jgi:hypothetical protein
LDEGARQVEALVRFAGAQAANSGKAVQLRFGEDVTISSSTNSVSENSASSVNDIPAVEDLEDWGTKLRVVYEADPVLQPGVFLDLAEAKPFLNAIAERVRIEKVRTPERPLNQSTNELAMAEGAAKSEGASAVTFYPDGSSETVEIFLISKEREDLREMVVKVDGVTGTVRTESVAMDDLVPVEWMDDGSSPQKKQAVTETGSTKEPSAADPSGQPTPMPEDPAFERPTNTELTRTNVFEDFP